MQSLLLLQIFFALHAFGTLISREFPHLIVPLDSNAPDTPQGTRNSGIVSNSVWTEVLFDVPYNSATYCRLNFYIGEYNNPPWTISGESSFGIYNLGGTCNKNTDTWNKHPPMKEYIASVFVASTGGVEVTSHEVPCLKGRTANYLLRTEHDEAFSLTWFELDSPVHGVVYEMYD